MAKKAKKHKADPQPEPQPGPKPEPQPEPLRDRRPDRGSGISPPGKVKGVATGRPRTGIAGLRARLGLNDRPAFASDNEVADTALALIAELEEALEKRQGKGAFRPGSYSMAGQLLTT